MRHDAPCPTDVCSTCLPLSKTEANLCWSPGQDTWYCTSTVRNMTFASETADPG